MRVGRWLVVGWVCGVGAVSAQEVPLPVPSRGAPEVAASPVFRASATVPFASPAFPALPATFAGMPALSEGGVVPPTPLPSMVRLSFLQTQPLPLVPRGLLEQAVVPLGAVSPVAAVDVVPSVAMGGVAWVKEGVNPVASDASDSVAFADTLVPVDSSVVVPAVVVVRGAIPMVVSDAGTRPSQPVVQAPAQIGADVPVSAPASRLERASSVQALPSMPRRAATWDNRMSPGVVADE